MAADHSGGSSSVTMNVGVLSNAIAVAIQQATGAQPTNGQAQAQASSTRYTIPALSAAAPAETT